MKKGSNAKDEAFKKWLNRAPTAREIEIFGRTEYDRACMETGFEAGWKAAKRHSGRKRKY